jgi:hypothetical protein
LRDPRIAALVAVHLSIFPRVPVPAILRWLKSWTARQANQLLGRSGQPFWQDESYDHSITGVSIRYLPISVPGAN